MISAHHTALVCDFADQYGVMDYRALSAKNAATLAAGLGVKSRVKQEIAGNSLPLDITLQAMLLDSFNHLIWMLAANSDETNHPPSVYNMLTGKRPQSDIAGFRSGNDFMEAWRR